MHHHAIEEDLNGTAIDTYDNHRMAMAFSLLACPEVLVTIRDLPQDLPQLLRHGKHLCVELASENLQRIVLALCSLSMV